MTRAIANGYSQRHDPGHVYLRGPLFAAREPIVDADRRGHGERDAEHGEVDGSQRHGREVATARQRNRSP